MIRFVRTMALAAALLPSLAYGQELAASGSLRAVYLMQNPVQAFTDPATGGVGGPAVDLTREIAARLGKPFVINGVDGVAAVLSAVKSGDADIGFLANDPVRTKEVDFTRSYTLAQNTFMVLGMSALRRGDLDKPNLRIGVAESDAADHFLTRTYKEATIVRNPGGDLAEALRQLEAKKIDAYAANRHRLTKFAESHPGVRVFPDNFYGVEQAVIVRRGNAAGRTLIDGVIEEMRQSGAIDDSIRRAGLVGVDVAPPPADSQSESEVE